MAMFGDSPAPVSLRVGDAERAAAVTRLTEAYANDYLPEAEFERRVTLVYQAAVADDLAALTRDLPVTGANASGSTQLAVSSPRRIRAVFSSVERGGGDAMPALLELQTVFGSLELNFTQCTFPADVTEIRVSVKFGSIELDFPDGVDIRMEGNATFASFEYRDYRPPGAQSVVPGSPIVRITGSAVMGSVEINQYLT
jgi:hypothetical protein